MILKNIIVFLDARHASLGRLEIATELSRKFRAYLIAIFVELPPKMHVDDGSPESFARGPGIASLVDAYLKQELSTIQFQKRHLEVFSREYDIGFEWRVLPLRAQLRDVVVQARYADITILGRPSTTHSFDRPFAWSSADVVLASGVPSIVVPEESVIRSLGKHIMIGWNASREARRAVSDSMSLLATAEKVTVLVIDPQVDIAHHGEEPGADIAGHLARHGVQVELETVESDGNSVATLLLQKAVQANADLLVAGAYGHSKVAEFVLGSTTRKIFSMANLPIFLSH